MLTTDGGLVFTGRMTGEFIAIDEPTGNVLWQFQTGRGSMRRLLCTPIRDGNTFQCYRASQAMRADAGPRRTFPRAAPSGRSR